MREYSSMANYFVRRLSYVLSSRSPLLPRRRLLARALATLVRVDKAEGLEQKEDVSFFGWARAVRKQKNLVFIELNDGSTPQHLQVVAPLAQFPHAESVNIGASLTVRGSVVKSTHPGQQVELRPTEIRILGNCDPKEYPFKTTTRHGVDYIRQFPHLRARTRLFSSVLRIRQTAAMAIHEFFQRRGYLLVHTPVLTSSDCEGAGEVFQAVAAKDSPNPERHAQFFRRNVFLTVSGQLHAEALASGMTSVYTFGPTFRAEKSHTRKHLSEFLMVEAEMVTVDTGLPHILELLEGLYKHTLESVLKQSSEDVKFIHETNAHPKIKDIVLNSLKQPFKHLSYTEAIDILTGAHQKEQFQCEPEWGSALKAEHEEYLVTLNGHVPIFVTDYPAATKPFYTRANEDSSNTYKKRHRSWGDKPGNEAVLQAAAVDLLAPVCGEVAGGSLREERPEILHRKLESLGILQDYSWYLDLRRFGTVPHGGFGLGFDRYLQAILGLEHIRDVIPFPVFLGSCEM